MSTGTELAKVENTVEVVRMSMETVDGFIALQRAAKLLAASSIVPDMYRGEQGMPNAVIALEMATRIGASPLMVMQNLYIVHGNPSWSAKFLIAAVNSCGRFTALRYESSGTPGKDDYRIRAWATERATGERLNGPWVTWQMVVAEGWLSKKGSKWQSMPELMGMYRAAAFWQRTYAPEISMGLRTSEEEADIIDVTPTREETADEHGAVTSAPAPKGTLASVKERLRAVPQSSNAVEASPVEQQEARAQPSGQAEPAAKAQIAEQEPTPSDDDLDGASEVSEDEPVIDPATGEVLEGFEAEAFRRVMETKAAKDIRDVARLVESAKKTLSGDRYQSLAALYYKRRHEITGKPPPSTSTKLPNI